MELASHRFVALLRAAWVEYERDRARYLAVAMIYYALVSLVPLLLLLLAALGLLLRFSAMVADAERRMLLGVEARFGPELPATINGLLDALQQESVVAMVISVAGLLLAGSALFRHLRLSFRAIWRYEPPLVAGSMRAVVRTTILEHVMAFGMVLGGGGLLLAAMVLIAAVQWLDRLLGRLPVVSEVTAWLLGASSSLVLAAITFAAMFKFLPPISVRWRDVWLPTLLCAIVWVVVSEVLALYSVFFDDGLSAYDALGGMLAAMLWMNIVSQLLFFGAELCKVQSLNSSSMSRLDR